MELPYLYNNDFNKKNLIGNSDSQYDLGSSEMSCDYQKFIDNTNSHLAQELLTVDKNIGFSDNLRGLSVVSTSQMYNQLPYIQQPSSSQNDREFGVKEEPIENEPLHDFSPCEFVGYSGGSTYGSENPYQNTPTTVAYGDSYQSPISSTEYAKESKGDRSDDEYRKRREKNNIAVRRSREKAKLRSRETEEKLKMLCQKNKEAENQLKLLEEQMKSMTSQLFVYRDIFNSINPDSLPEPLKTRLRNRLQILNNYSEPQSV